MKGCKNKYLLNILFLSLVLFLPQDSFSQNTMFLSGKQSRFEGRFSSKLESKPVQIFEKSEIVRVKGGQRGFWINRKDGYQVDTVYKFWDVDEAIGKILEPGTYVVYPNLDKGSRQDIVIVYLKPTGKSNEDRLIKSKKGQPSAGYEEKKFKQDTDVEWNWSGEENIGPQWDF